MEEALIFYFVWSAIVMIISFAAIFSYGVSKREPGIIVVGIFGTLISLSLFIPSTTILHEPKAIEVYQGKTTLEYTVKGGVAIDSVVVYKEKK